MSEFPELFVFGAFAVGVSIGLVLRGQLMMLGYHRQEAAMCEICGDNNGAVNPCKRCRRCVSRCCSFVLIGREIKADGPPPPQPVHICKRCLTREEKEVLEGLVGR